MYIHVSRYKRDKNSGENLLYVQSSKPTNNVLLVALKIQK